MIRERTYTNLLIGLVLSLLIHAYIVIWVPPFSMPTPTLLLPSEVEVQLREGMARKGITLFCPPKPRRNAKNDPDAPRPGDPPEIVAWRQRMVDDVKAGKGSWIRRRGEHERINANFRRQGLQQFNVRGSFKVKAVSLLHALANNVMAAVRLRAAAA